MALHALGSPSFSSFISCHQSSSSPLILLTPHFCHALVFCQVFAHMIPSTWNTIFCFGSPCWLPTQNSLFSFFLQNPENPWSQGKWAQDLVQRWTQYPVSTNYLYEEVTMKHLEGFSLPDNRKVCKQKLSTPISPTFLSQKIDCEAWTCCRPMGEKKEILTGLQASWNLCTNARNSYHQTFSYVDK